MWQARRVASLLSSKLDLDAEPIIIKTSGDRIQDLAFHKMEGKGFFTRELQEALLTSHVDVVVHSMKDLPTEAPEDLGVAAIPERASPADLLLGQAGSIVPTASNPLGLAEGSVLGTSSLRRASQSLALEPKLEIKALRGNVPTRVTKLREGGYDAILLAAAGVDRLGLDLEGLDRLDLPPEVMLPAPAQGALAIEARIDDPLFQDLATLHDSDVARAVSAERTLLQLLGGGCHLPLGCLATQDDVGLRLQAVLGEIDQSVSRAVVSRVATVAQDPETAARCCYEALKLAAPEVVGS